jgi:hypothetical protein
MSCDDIKCFFTAIFTHAIIGSVASASAGAATRGPVHSRTFEAVTRVGSRARRTRAPERPIRRSAAGAPPRCHRVSVRHAPLPARCPVRRLGCARVDPGLLPPRGRRVSSRSAREGPRRRHGRRRARRRAARRSALGGNYRLLPRLLPRFEVAPKDCGRRGPSGRVGGRDREPRNERNSAERRHSGAQLVRVCVRVRVVRGSTASSSCIRRRTRRASTRSARRVTK